MSLSLAARVAALLRRSPPAAPPQPSVVVALTPRADGDVCVALTPTDAPPAPPPGTPPADTVLATFCQATTAAAAAAVHHTDGGATLPSLPPGHPASIALLEASAALLFHGATPPPPGSAGGVARGAPRAAADALRGLFARRGEGGVVPPPPLALLPLQTRSPPCAVERSTHARLGATGAPSLTGWVAASAAVGVLGERLAATAAAVSTLPLFYHPWAALRARNARSDLAAAAGVLAGVAVGGGGGNSARAARVARSADGGGLSDVSTGDEADADELDGDGDADGDGWRDLAAVLGEEGGRSAARRGGAAAAVAVTPLAPAGATHALYRVTCPPHPPTTHRFRDVARWAAAAVGAGVPAPAPWRALVAETRTTGRRLDAAVIDRRAAGIAAALNATFDAAGGVEAATTRAPGAAALASLVGAPPPPATTPRPLTAGRSTRLVLTRPSTPRPDTAVATAQGGACAACGSRLTPPTLRCGHCDALVCGACAPRGRGVPLPASVLASFDFAPARVCADCSDFLSGAATRPLLPVDAAAPHLLTQVPALAAAAAARRRALAALAAAAASGLAGAAAAARLVRSAPPRRAHLLDPGARGFWSMADLEDIAGGPLALLPAWLERVAAAATAAARVGQ